MAAGGAHHDQREGRWSTIPRELLQLIRAKVYHLGDFIRLGAVCKSWYSSPILLLLPDRECLLPEDDDADEVFIGRQVLDLTTRTLHKFPLLPEALDSYKSVVGSSFGWLVTMDYSYAGHAWVLELIKPCSSSFTIPLPPAPGASGGNIFNICYDVKKIVLSTCAEADDCRVMIIHGFDSTLSCFCRTGDWTDLNHELYDKPYADVIHYKGEFYVVTYHGVLLKCDLGRHPNMVIVAPEPEPPIYSYKTKKYLVGAGEDLLMVEREYGDHRRTKRFFVYRLDVLGEKWEGVKSLDDRMLFLGEKFSLSVSATTHEMYKCKPNSIYFIDSLSVDDSDKIQVSVYDLEEEKSRILYSYRYNVDLDDMALLVPPSLL